MMSPRQALGLLLAALLASPCALADDAQRLAQIQQRWAEIQYRLPSAEKPAAFEQLAGEARAFTQAVPQSAPALIWQGIVLSSWAGAQGGLGALGKVKEARSDLEQALKLDPSALQGSAYTSLAALYDRVPGWPIAFGDASEADRLLQQALALNPTGIDTLYFWGDHLYRQKRYAEARAALLKAQQAAPRPGRELADQGRRGEIAALLKDIDQKLK
jgi:tetratricopeptide (TPR) repeat protein